MSGFAFTTANDVETRTLPLLADQASEIAFRLGCHTTQSPDSCCRLEPPAGDDAGSQIDDASQGCAAKNLAQYCDYKYGSDTRTSDAWAGCLGVVEAAFKAKCEANPNAGHCSFNGIWAQDIDGYCAKRAAGVVDEASEVTLPDLGTPANKEDCLEYAS